MSKSDDIAVSVRGLSKCYTIAHNQEKHVTLAETALAWAKNPFRRSEKETLWALKDVSFDVRRGEVVGIIGRNGAGKSTLLKILSRITEPTAGEIDVYGRIGSLLEVGTGFHPELTGRENIYLNGAILGMRRKEIDCQFDAIVDFSGVERFLDTPVKRYSSGMYVRLAFAVAAHLEPEILIVDEVLAVGDAEFQKKCIGKLGEVTKCGRTVLFVSHNIAAIKSLCNRAALLDRGNLDCVGDTSDVLARYLDAATAPPREVTFEAKSAEGFFRRIAVLNRDNRADGDITVQSPCKVILDYSVRRPLPGAVVSFSVWRREGSKVFFCPNYTGEVGARTHPAGEFTAEVEIPGNFLAPGQFTVNAGIYVPGVAAYDVQEHRLGFDVVDGGSAHFALAGADLGCVLVQFPWKSRRTGSYAETV